MFGYSKNHRDRKLTRRSWLQRTKGKNKKSSSELCRCVKWLSGSYLGRKGVRCWKYWISSSDAARDRSNSNCTLLFRRLLLNYSISSSISRSWNETVGLKSDWSSPSKIRWNDSSKTTAVISKRGTGDKLKSFSQAWVHCCTNKQIRMQRGFAMISWKSAETFKASHNHSSLTWKVSLRYSPPTNSSKRGSSCECSSSTLLLQRTSSSN